MTVRAPHRARSVVASLAAIALTACGQNPPLPFLPTPEPTPEQPRPVEVAVRAATGGEPIAEAQVVLDGRTVLTATDGTVTISALSGDEVAAQADGYDAADARVQPEGGVTLELRRNVARGVVSDPSGAPIAGARVFVEGGAVAAVTDEQGRYEL
ncbi:MAG: hypothetical protein ACRDGJ_04980, partial [Candidatus Limnocylindria bacterium]